MVRSVRARTRARARAGVWCLYHCVKWRNDGNESVNHRPVVRLSRSGTRSADVNETVLVPTRDGGVA